MNEPIRVLQVIGIMDQGGAEAMIMNLYRYIDRSRVEFDFVENENDGAYFDEEIESLGGKIYHCPRFTGKNLLAYKKWWKKFFDTHKEYLAVHGHIGSTAAFYLKEAKKHGLTTIAHSHNTSVKNRKQFFYDVLSFPTRSIADHLFMCSKQAGTDRYGAEAVQQKGHLFPNAVDTELFRYDEKTRKNKRKELGISDNSFLVGHIGRFAEQKNHLFLLDIFKEIVSLHPDSVLLLVGDGELRQQIEAKIKTLNLEGKVVLLGLRSDVNELLMAMDVLVFPSKYEGLPVTLVEAQCSGLPCVISDKVPSDSILIKELIQVCSLADSSSEWAEIALLKKDIGRSSCAEKIREAGFDVESNAKWLEDFYCEQAK